MKKPIRKDEVDKPHTSGLFRKTPIKPGRDKEHPLPSKPVPQQDHTIQTPRHPEPAKKERGCDDRDLPWPQRKSRI